MTHNDDRRGVHRYNFAQRTATWTCSRCGSVGHFKSGPGKAQHIAAILCTLCDAHAAWQCKPYIGRNDDLTNATADWDRCDCGSGQSFIIRPLAYFNRSGAYSAQIHCSQCNSHVGWVASK